MPAASRRGGIQNCALPSEAVGRSPRALLRTFLPRVHS